MNEINILPLGDLLNLAMVEGEVRNMGWIARDRSRGGFALHQTSVPIGERDMFRAYGAKSCATPEEALRDYLDRCQQLRTS